MVTTRPYSDSEGMSLAEEASCLNRIPTGIESILHPLLHPSEAAVALARAERHMNKSALIWNRRDKFSANSLLIGHLPLSISGSWSR